MSTDKEDLAIDDEFQITEEDAEPQPEVAKTNLSKRRTIDNMLEERRLQSDLVRPSIFSECTPMCVRRSTCCTARRSLAFMM